MKTLLTLKVWLVLAIFAFLPLLMAPSGGFPSRPRFSAVGVNAVPLALQGTIIASAAADTAAVPQLQVLNTTAGCTGDMCIGANFSNATDADFMIRVTDVGAAAKYARIGPSANIPLQVISRNTTQELLKSAGMYATGGASCSITRNYSVTSCVRNSVGNYTVNITAANFTLAPVCSVSAGTGSGALIANAAASSATSVAVLGYLVSGALNDLGDFNLVCVGQ